jgi:phasin
MRRIVLMTEAEAKARTAKPMSGTTNAAFAIPKFEIPQFDVPKMEIPAAFREFAEKGASQAKKNCETMKAAAEEASAALEGTYAIATKGAADYGRKLIEAARTNTNAAFNFYGELMAVKSMAEVLELSTAHARKQFDALSVQTKELAGIAQKVAVDASEAVQPMKESLTKAFKKVA